MSDPIDDVLKELAETANYLRETARIGRRAVERLIDVEEDFVKTNRYLTLMVEHLDKAINASLRVREAGGKEPS